MQYAGADPGFQVRGGARLTKLRRAEGGAKNVGVFRVKNHDFTPKKSYFFQFKGVARRVPPLDPPPNMDYTPLLSAFKMKTKNIRITSIQIYEI